MPTNNTAPLISDDRVEKFFLETPIGDELKDAVLAVRKINHSIVLEKRGPTNKEIEWYWTTKEKIKKLIEGLSDDDVGMLYRMQLWEIRDAD